MAAEDAIRPFLAALGETSHGARMTTPGAPGAVSIPRQQDAICCCGQADCLYLERNCSAIEALERDVRNAAQLGQALLVRHEAYIADAERERKHMMDAIEDLEQQKQTLETRNALVIKENRSLLDQLEAVNNAAAESDARVTSLQATLQSVHHELQRLTLLAARTERLEQQLAEFERDQVSWQTSLDAKDEAERSALGKLRDAQRALAGLQDQLDMIERDAKEERERHADTLARLERRHSVEKDLTSAAGRLKGAAAASKVRTKDESGGTVVSHFVKDILHDNANLQMGIVELRTMLQMANDEVETLRRQLHEHRPLEEGFSNSSFSDRKDLKTELRKATSSELHVHHHFHAQSAPRQSAVSRRPKKKRYGVLTPGSYDGPLHASTPRTSISSTGPVSATTNVEQAAVTVPRAISAHGSRWSVQTLPSLYSSSGPSSPQSTARDFDRVFSEVDHDSSRATTPGSEEPTSPVFGPVQLKRMPASAMRTRSAPIVHRRSFSPAAGQSSLDSILRLDLDDFLHADHQRPGSSDPIIEEDELDWEDENVSAPTGTVSEVASPSQETAETVGQKRHLLKPRALRRAASHESLLSEQGMDIHTLRSRPSQMLTASGSRSFTAATVLSDETAHAVRPAVASKPSIISRDLLSGMAGDLRLAGPATTTRPHLGQKVSGWVLGRWGGTGPPDTMVVAASESSRPPSIRSASSKSTTELDPASKAMTKRPTKQRMPGINQSGPIPGFGPEVRVQHPPVLRSLDRDALRRILDGESSE